MKLSDLIQQIGDDRVVLQALVGSVVKYVDTKDGGKLTFFTDNEKALDVVGLGPGKWVGLVLWLPKADVDRFRASEAAAEADDEPLVEPPDVVSTAGGVP